MAQSSLSTSARSWRTAFLTLRDETLTNPPLPLISQLLHDLIFSDTNDLIHAASDLPPHEVVSDTCLLMELVRTSCSAGDDMTLIFTHASRFIHDIHRRVSFEIYSSSWTLVLGRIGEMLEFFLGKSSFSKADPSGIGNAARVRPVMECLETVRRISNVSHRRWSLSENTLLVKFLLNVIVSLDAKLSQPVSNERCSTRNQITAPRSSYLWELYTIAFSMLGDAISRTGPSIPVDIWKSIIEVMRKTSDLLASKTMLVEDCVMSRFHESFLYCLHLILMDLKCSISDHVSGFIAFLRMFFAYGLISKVVHSCVLSECEGSEHSLMSRNSSSEESKKANHSPYRPPHLRKKQLLDTKQISWGYESIVDNESSNVNMASSDSDFSDSDGSVRDMKSALTSKVRTAAIVCVQDLCQADAKSFSAHWSVLLPTSDVLQPRRFEATVMTCLLYDPCLKVRMASASALAVMLDGPSSIFLQVAEYRDTVKSGSFTALSCSLGHILMQLHRGILYLIERETHGRLLASIFKILVLLISSTPYSRMPLDLLTSVMASLHQRIKEGFPFKNDQTGLLAAAIGCLTSAFSTTPPSLHVKDILLKEITAGYLEDEKNSGILLTLFEFSNWQTSPTICLESLQALRSVSHNYPDVINLCWEQISVIVHGFLRIIPTENLPRTSKGHSGNPVVLKWEKVVTAAIKVLDECLRAACGFQGTEDFLDDNLWDNPFTSDCIRMKVVSSAPSYEPVGTDDNVVKGRACDSGIKQWTEAIEKHMPLVLWHSSPMVRVASVTCFAGITSAVFMSLNEEKKNSILSYLTSAAIDDGVPSVRSAACRAIGVISCFSQVRQSAETLHRFIQNVEINTCDPLVSVRITASWALANICDSIRHCMNDFPFKLCTDSNTNSSVVVSLTHSALRLTKDGDKIKSNAVRALGYLSRILRCTALSSVQDKPGKYEDIQTLEKVVRALISCVATGNVKVQWNVCHAFGNLFLNEMIRLPDMDWAPSVFSILLLLLRDASNFKIRIQAAAALAIPVSVFDYGQSFPDVVQGVVQIVENIGADHISVPSNFKYRIALEKQLTSTLLHVLSLSSSADHQPLKDFLVKKASFIEDWLKVLCLSLAVEDSHLEVGNKSKAQKKQMISKMLKSIIEVYKARKQHAIIEKFEMLENSL